MLTLLLHLECSDVGSDVHRVTMPKRVQHVIWWQFWSSQAPQKNDIVGASGFPRMSFMPKKPANATGRDGVYSFQHACQRIQERYPGLELTHPLYDELCSRIRNRDNVVLVNTEHQAGRIQQTFRIPNVAGIDVFAGLTR